MASSSIRLRRPLSAALSTFHRSFSAPIHRPLSTPNHHHHHHHHHHHQSPPQFQSTRAFRSSPISLLSTRPSSSNDEIGPDTILFEGCDYNHWLFVMDFPKDNKPSPEQMFGRGKEENICLQHYHLHWLSGCHELTEEESKKFESLPGVIFVLPDSYIDPVNKQYGVQYGRNQRRQDDRRGPGRYNQQGNQMSNPQGNFSYNNRGPMQGDGRNYGPQQNYHQPQQNHGQASQNFPPQQNYGQASQNYPPQQNYGQASQNYPPQHNRGQASPNYTPHPQQQRHRSASPQYAQQQNFGPPGQGERRNYVPQQNFGPPGQGERRDPATSPGGTGTSQSWDATSGTPSYVKDFKPSYMEEFEQFGQANQGNYPPKEQTGSQQRYPPPGQGNFTGEGRY
ncbi:hypothetical protein OROGR_014538 [Orobanche gracilis]